METYKKHYKLYQDTEFDFAYLLQKDLKNEPEQDKVNH